MYYSSDWIEKILTNEKAREILGWLPPVYSQAYVFLWLLQKAGGSIEHMEDLAENFVEQIVPQTATWSIPYWEERYEIISNDKLSLSERRQKVITKRKTKAPMPPKKIEDIIIEITGLETSIQENTGRNHFTVMCDGYISPKTMKIVRKELDKVKPSHLIYTIVSSFFYAPDITVYTASVVSSMKTYSVREVI